MKTPHRLIHDAKEAGAITEQEWRAFMRARNEADKFVFDSFLMANFASEALDLAFSWRDSEQGGVFWLEICNRLEGHEESRRENGQ